MALVDKANENTIEHYQRLEAMLGDRLFVLAEETLEEYLDESLYKRCNIPMHGDARKRFGKTDIAKSIADELNKEDLPLLQIIVDAVKKALHPTLSL